MLFRPHLFSKGNGYQKSVIFLAKALALGQRGLYS